jgi:16S rRNA (uracil1498-N3)-methyltransferase
MNSILLFDNEQIAPNMFRLLAGERLTHLLEHLKARPGDRLHFTVIAHGLAHGTLTSQTSEEAIITLDELTPQSSRSLSIMVGLSRPPTMKKIIEHGSTMGVGRFFFVKTQLADPNFANSKVLSLESIKSLTLLGLSQSRCYAHPPSFEHLSKVEIPLDAPKLRFYLSLNTDKTFLDYSAEIRGSYPELFIAVGPERGWTLEEERLLEAQDCFPIKLSQSTLRVEHAVFASLAQLEMIARSSE